MNLSWQSVSWLKCKDYLYIKPSGKNEFITVDKYYSNIIEKNSKCKFTHKMLSGCKFKYRDKIMKYNELCTIDSNKMVLPTFYDATAQKNELMGTVTQERGYCLRLLNTFDRYLGKARYETIKAATILDVDYLNSDLDQKLYDWQYFQRCYNAENAIYSYYSLYEIIILLIYINEHQTVGKSFEDYSKECRSNSYRKKLKQVDNVLFLLVSDGTTDAKIHSDFEKIYDWCNTFKHRGVLRFEGEYKENLPYSKFIPEANSGLKPYFSINNEFAYIDLDKDVIPELFGYHKKIVELAEKVINHCKIKESEIGGQING